MASCERYRVQLDLSLRRPGVAVACAIDTNVLFAGEDKLVVASTDGVNNVFSNVSLAECDGVAGGLLYRHALAAARARVGAARRRGHEPNGRLRLWWRGGAAVCRRPERLRGRRAELDRRRDADDAGQRLRPSLR